MADNKNMNEAKKAKNDEFYTQLPDIEKELNHQEYKEEFKNKIIYCNCDTTGSQFYTYFKDNFTALNLKKLIITGLGGEKVEYNGDTEIKTKLQGNGDFRSPECLQILSECDVVVTNPPFSLFREWIDVVILSGKKFACIGNMNCITYKEVFPLIKNNQMWMGYKSLGSDMYFDIPESQKQLIQSSKTNGGGWKLINGDIKARVATACWFTNIPLQKLHQPILLCKEFSLQEYPKYDNYCAFNVDRVKDIPKDTFIELEIPDKDYDLWKNVYGEDLEVIL